METLILSWFVMVNTGSVLLLTAFGSLQFLGTLAAPMFGVLGDALGARVMLCAMRAAYAVLAGLLMVLALGGVLTPTWVFVVAGLAGIVRPNDQVLRNALIGETIPPDHLIGALGLSRGSTDSARVVGALTGAGLSTVLGIGYAYVVVTSVYLASLALTFGVSRARPVPDPGAAPSGAFTFRTSSWRDLKDGLVHVLTTPTLLALMWLAFLVNLTAYPVTSGLLPYVARSVYRVDATGLGLARGELLAGRAAGLDDHGDDGRAAPPGALDAREHRHLVRAAVRLRPRAGHDGGVAHAPSGRPRPEHGDDLDDGHAARGGGRPVPRARDGRAHARRLRHDRGADRLRRPDRARRLFAHHQRLLHGRPGLHAHHRHQVARQHVAAEAGVADGAAIHRVLVRRVLIHRVSVVHGPPGAARRHDQLTGHRPRLVRREERRDVGDLGGVHHAADGVAARRILGEVAALGFLGRDAQLLGSRGQQARRALRARRPGVNAVDRDPEAPELDGQRLGHVNDRCIAGATAQVAGVARVGAADVDDAAPLLLLHVRDRGAGAAERPHVLHVEVLEQVLVDDGLDGAGGRGRAPGRRAAVDQDVQPAELPSRLGHHRVHLRLAGDVGDQRDHAAARLGRQLARGGFELILRAGRDRHVRALAGQLSGNRLSDAEAASGHDRTFALKPEVHRVPSRCVVCAAKFESAILSQAGGARPARSTHGARRPPIRRAKRGVEAPDAGEPGGERDRAHRQRGLVDQDLGALHASGRRDGGGRRPGVAHEQPAQMPGRHAQRVGEIVDGLTFVEEAAPDEPHGARDGCRRTLPRRRSRHRLGQAPTAWGEARSLGGGRRGEGHDVARPGRLHGTGGPAVDPGGQHAGGEPPVEPTGARQTCAIAPASVEGDASPHGTRA